MSIGSGGCALHDREPPYEITEDDDSPFRFIYDLFFSPSESRCLQTTTARVRVSVIIHPRATWELQMVGTCDGKEVGLA